MAMSDKLLTMVTGGLLAIGGGAASLFLGGEHSEGTVQSNSLVVASLTAPQIPTGAQTLPDLDFAELTVRDAPTLPTTSPIGGDVLAGLNRDLIFAAVEPQKRKAPASIRTDLAKVAVLDGAPALAKPADFADIVLTRSIASVPAPKSPRVASGIPTLSVDIPKDVIVPKVARISCAMDVRATPISGARVTLRVEAPCHPNVAITIEHGGLRFKEALDDQGQLSLKVPVFAEYSRFVIELADGTQSTVGAYIAGLSRLERVGIAWNGANDTFLHAFQDGAKADDTGHVWRFNARSFATSRMDGGGYMAVLGNPDLENAELAQVYTMPVVATKRTQIVSLAIETLRAEDTCGAAQDVEIAQHRAKSGAANSTLSLTLPDCGAVQSNLVLKNVLKDLKVARK